MTQLPASSDTAASPRLVEWSRTSRRASAGSYTETLAPAPLAEALTDLSYMVTRVHAIRGRGGVPRDLDKRLTGVSAELESLIHDLLHDAGHARNGAGHASNGVGHASNGTKTPPTQVTSSVAADASGRTRAEAAFEEWLTSGGKPDVAQTHAPDEPLTSVTGMLGELTLSQRELPAHAAAELGMPPGTTLGYAATELLLAVNDPAGPRCRSYRAALYYLRDHDDSVVGR